MRKKTIQQAKSVGFLVMIVLLLAGPAGWALAPEYMRNGECYLLIGHSDVSFRGVYRLNNPAGEADGNPVGVKLYDPKTSYGISVNLDRNVYTFSENQEPSYSYDSSWTLKRQMKIPGGVSLYGAHCDTRKSYYVSTENLTYNESNKPVYTTTGPMGNETGTASDGSHNISWEWSGTVSVLSKEADRWRIGKTNVLCDTNCIYTNGLSDAYWLYFVDTDASGYGTVPNGAWWQSQDADPVGRPGNLIYWDRAFRKYTFYDLNSWDKSMGIWSSSTPVYAQPVGPADSIFEENVKRSRISACLNCACVNGSVETQFNPDPKFVSLALSPFGRMYLYSRTENSTSDAIVKMNGSPVSDSNPNIRGYVNNLSTKWIGVSAKSPTEDFIYLLGTDIIREWLASYSIFPGSLDIESVTVSDQWWLEGGIIYAYDRTSPGIVYQFIRNDSYSNNTCKSTPLPITLGTDIDDIKADGFGNLFFAKTTKTPSNSSDLSWDNVLSFTFLQTYGGQSYGQITYGQKVFKTVYERELGATVDSTIGSTWIGYNKFTQNFSVADADWPNLTLDNLSTYAGLPTWHWHGGLVAGDVVTNPLEVQIGVINVSTPPRVTKPNEALGRIDIYAFDDVNNLQLPYDYGTTDINQGLYTFKVENAPYWEGRNNQAVPGKGKWTGDQNANGFEGGFVSSLMNTTTAMDTSPQVLYTWRIYRIQDPFGNPPLTGPELIKEMVDTTVPEVKYFFRSGLYQIECSTRFKWYNYDTLGFGSTVASLSDCIRPTDGYEVAEPAPLPAGITPTSVPGLKSPIPANTTVALIKINRQPAPPVGETVTIQKKKPVDATWDSPATTGELAYHVINEKENYDWRVQGSDLPNVFSLPTIIDQAMVPGTMEWQNDMPVQMEWSFNLLLPDGGDFPAFSLSKTTVSQDDTAIPFKLDFPTDPVLGSLTCKIYRDWQYQQNQYDEYGNYTGWIYVKGHIEYNGETGILVLDLTPPEIVSINGHNVIDLGPKNPVYLGLTYGLNTDSLSHGGLTNPASFSIIVRDNNLYANLNSLSPIPESAHNRGIKQIAMLQFERGTDKSLFPSGPGAAWNWYTSPGVTTVPDITTAWSTHANYKLMRKPRPYVVGDQYSFIEYVFRISDWQDLQVNTGDSTAMDYCCRWPVDFANNSPTYNGAGAVGIDHPGFALFFRAQDSSGRIATDSADNIVLTHLGNVWLRDSLRPVPRVHVVDYTQTVDELVPFNITSYMTTHPNPLAPAGSQIMGYHLLPNTEQWIVDNNGNIPSVPNVLGIPWGLATELGTTYHPPRIDEGMEVFLTVSADDNIAVFTDPTTPLVTVTGPIGLYTEGAPPQIDATSFNNGQVLRILLERAGVYNLTLTAHDTALDFDGSSSPNTREIRLSIVAAPTIMNIRVIDRKDSKL